MILSKLVLVLLAGLVTAHPDQLCSDEDAARIRKYVGKNWHHALGSTCACETLTREFSERVLHPGSNNYTTEAKAYWDIREDLSPKCIFVPGNAHEVAKGVIVLTACKSRFAVRGAGHMPVKGAANTDGGVLVALNSFKNYTILPEEGIMEAGPALNWGQVYSALVPYGKIVIGGRLKDIGTGGLTLGGGIHYFTNKYGFAMDNVVSYEVVTADGKIVDASATCNPDLFWALKGGSNNFGIVTKFTYKTFDVPVVSTQFSIYAEAALPAFSKGIAGLGQTDDANPIGAGGTFSLLCNVTGGPGLLQMLGVQEGATSSQFANFSSIPAEATLLNVNNVTTLAQASTILSLIPYQASRWTFGAKSIVGIDADNIVEMYQMLKAAVVPMANITGLNPTMTFQPIPKSAAAVAAHNGIGNTWGVDDSTPHNWWLITVSWQNASDDEVVLAWHKKTLEAIHASNKAKGIASDFIYLNDAADYQKGYDGIPTANLAKMKSIRAKYDPDLVFTKLCSGGFKLD